MTDQRIEMDRYLVVAHWTDEETPQLRSVQVFGKTVMTVGAFNVALLTLKPEEVEEISYHLSDLRKDMESQKKVEQRRKR